MYRVHMNIYIYMSIVDWIVFPQNSHVEALTHNVIKFGDKAFKEVIKVKWGHKCGALIQ